MSVQDVFANLIRREVEVGGEFEPGDGMMGLLAQGGSDAVHEIAAVALTFAGNALDVFGVDAKPGGSGFHMCGFVSTKFGSCRQPNTQGRHRLGAIFVRG